MNRYLDSEENIIDECETIDEFINAYYNLDHEFYDLKFKDENMYKDLFDIVKDSDKYKLLYAEFYAYGKVVDEDNRKYFEIINELVKKKDKRAMCYLGAAYYNGEGIEKDQALGLKYLEKSSELGYSMADYALCLHYANHYAVSKLNKHKAKIREKGNKRARFMLALSYIEAKSYPDAFKLMMQSAKAGYDLAMYMVAEMYLEGKGIKRCETDANLWMKKAAELGNPKAKKYLEEK